MISGSPPRPETLPRGPIGPCGRAWMRAQGVELGAHVGGRVDQERLLRLGIDDTQRGHTAGQGRLLTRTLAAWLPAAEMRHAAVLCRTQRHDRDHKTDYNISEPGLFDELPQFR